MKSEDFERLKAVCEKEGFEIGFKYDESTYTVRLKKDIWEGVEFFEDKNCVYKIIKHLSDSVFLVQIGIHQFQCTKTSFKPSTESAYIEQLKEEANNRKIISICNLDISMMDGGQINDTSTEFKYRKDIDTFYWFGCPIYQSGKWATRVPERVKVDPDSAISITDAINQCFRKDSKDFSKFLAKQLEEYLNK